MALSSTTPSLLEDLYVKFSLDDEITGGLSYAVEPVESHVIAICKGTSPKES